MSCSQATHEPRSRLPVAPGHLGLDVHSRRPSHCSYRESGRASPGCYGRRREEVAQRWVLDQARRRELRASHAGQSLGCSRKEKRRLTEAPPSFRPSSSTTALSAPSSSCSAPLPSSPSRSCTAASSSLASTQQCATAAPILPSHRPLTLALAFLATQPSATAAACSIPAVSRVHVPLALVRTPHRCGTSSWR